MGQRGPRALRTLHRAEALGQARKHKRAGEADPSPPQPAPARSYSLSGSVPAAAPTPPAAARARRSCSSAHGERPEAAGAEAHGVGTHGAHVAGATEPSSTQRRLLLLNLLGSRMSSTEKEVGRGGAAGRAAPAPSGTAGTVSLAASGGAPALGKAGSSARPSIASRAAAAGAGGAGPGPGPGGGGGSAGTSPGAAGPLALMPASRRSGGSGPAAYWAPILGCPRRRPQRLGAAPPRPVMPGAASAAASGARRARPAHLWRPRRRRPRAHTPHTRAPAGGRRAPPPSLARTPNWLRTTPGRGGGPRVGHTDGAAGPDGQTHCPEPERSPLRAVGQQRVAAPQLGWKPRARLLREGGGDSRAFK